VSRVPAGPADAAPRAVRPGADRAAATRRVDLGAGVLFPATLACSVLIGYVAGEGAARESARTAPPNLSEPAAKEPSTGTPAGLGAAVAAVPIPRRIDALVDDGIDTGEGVDPLWSELGRVRAEILRLRILFRRLAEVAELDDGEFDLDLDPLELPAVRRAVDALDLSIRALDPISAQGARMARIFDLRRAAHGRRIGGRVAPGTVRSSGFGYRPRPFGGRRELHRGVDLAGRPGTPIHVLADGIVAFSGADGGYGNLVEIEHGDGYRTRYAHNRSNLVAAGDRVAKGDVVATLGSSGRSTGPHVHVEVHHDGAVLDPTVYLR